MSGQSQAQVDILEVGGREPLVEPAHDVPRPAGDQQAIGGGVVHVPGLQIGIGPGRQPLPHVGGRPVTPENRSGLLQGAVNREDAGPDSTDLRVGRSGSDQRIDASFLDGAVVIEEDQQRGPRHGGRLVAAGAEAQIDLVDDQDHIVVTAQAVQLFRWRAVGHHHHLGARGTSSRSP